MSLSKGTPLSSQIVWFEKKVSEQTKEIERLKQRNAELEQALRKCHDALETFANDESAEGWIAIGGILEARKALEGKP